MKIFLIGYMLCGKSTIGRKLAKKLGYDFSDTDKMIENKYHLSVEKIFEQYGEQTFRILEKEILKEIKSLDNIVIATGGGLPCFGNNMNALKQMGRTIYLKMSPKSIIARHKISKRPRPLLKGKDDEQLLDFVTKSLEEREFFYQQADITIRSESIDIAEIIAKI